MKNEEIQDAKKAKRKKIFKIIAIVTFVPKIFTYSYFGYYFLVKRSKKNVEILGNDDLSFKSNFKQELIPYGKPSRSFGETFHLTKHDLHAIRERHLTK